jgi:hypothetical protein
MNEAIRVQEVLMVVNVTPSRNAPPGRLRSGVGAMALVTAFPVAANGSHADNSAGLGAAGPHSTHAGGSSAPPQPPRAGERFLAGPPVGAAVVRKQDAKTPGLGWQCSANGAAGAEVEEGDAAWVDTWARLVTTKGRTEASRRRMPHGYHITQTPEERLT